MRLEEAIKHAEEKSSEDTPCGRDHKQLAKWLRELKELRKLEKLRAASHRNWLKEN